MVTIMLIWCLNHVKEFILKFSISGSCFSDKEFLNLFTMILFSFSLGGYVDELLTIRKNYQEYKYLHFLQLLHIDSHLFLEW